MIDTRVSHQSDCLALSRNLRQADLDEIQAASGVMPHLALLRGFEQSSHCYTIVRPEAVYEPLAMFGVVSMALNPSVGQVWFLGSDEIKLHSMEFLRKSKGWVHNFHTEYPVLYNNIDSRNTVHIKWLQWLGFQFINELHNYGHEGRTFYHFVRINNV